MAKKETGEDILKAIMEKGSSKAAGQAAEALGVPESEPEPETPRVTPPPSNKPEPPKEQPKPAAPLKKGTLSNLTEKLKSKYSAAGGAKGIAKKGAIGTAKGIGKLALGGLKLGAGAALGVGGLVAGGTINALGLSEIATATVAGTALVNRGLNSAFGKKNDNVKPGSSGKDGAGSSLGLEGLQAAMEQLITINNSILSATKQNNSSIQDVVSAIDRQTGNFEANLRTTNDILKQINASILGSKTGGGAPSPEKNGGLLAGLMALLTGIMDGFKFLKGLLDVAIKSIFKIGSLIESLFKAVGGLFSRGGAKVAAEAGAAVAAEGAEKLAEKGAAKVAEKGAAEAAEKGAAKVVEEGAVKAAETGAAEVAGKGGLKVAGETVAKGAAKVGLKAIPILGDVAIGALQAAESGSIGEGIAAGLGSFGGRILGGLGGAAAGSVVPIAGTAAGGFAGEVAGSIAGSEGAAALYRWFAGGDKKKANVTNTSSNNADIDPIIADDLTNRLETMHTAGVISDNSYKIATDSIKSGKLDVANKIVMQAESSVAPSSNITADINGISVTPTPNASSIPFNQQSAQLALNKNTTTPPPVIINNNNTTMGGGGGGSNNPPRSSGAVSTSPNQSHVDRVLYGDLYGAGVP